MTAEEYHLLAPMFDFTEHRIEQEIKQIPSNINPAGKHYKKLVKQIRLRHEAT